MPPPAFPPLSISPTQITLRETCARKWWFRYVAHWNGWLKDASQEAQQAYRIGKLESVATWTGKRVHDGISVLLRDESTPVRSVMDRIEAGMRAEFNASQIVGVGKFGEAKVFRLEEHFFGTQLDPVKMEESIASVRTCLEAFMSYCDAEPSLNFRALSQDAAAARRFLHVDHESIPMDSRGFTAPDIAGGQVTVYAAPDFVVETADRRLIVIDWKTGNRWGPSENELTSQLESYSAWLWLRHRPAVEAATNVEFYEFHLPDCKPAGRPANRDDFVRAAERVREQAKALLDLRGNSKAVRREACPPKPDVMRCNFCPFKQLCPEGIECLSSRKA